MATAVLRNPKILIGNKTVHLSCFVMKATEKYRLISTYWRTFLAERFPSVLFGINILSVLVKLSNVEAATRKMNRQKEETIDQGSDAGSG